MFKFETGEASKKSDKNEDLFFTVIRNCFVWTMDKQFINDDVKNIINSITNHIKKSGVDINKLIEFEDFWKKTNEIGCKKYLQINDILNFVKKKSINECKLCNGSGWIAVSTGDCTAKAVRCTCMPEDQYIRYDKNKHEYLYAMKD